MISPAGGRFGENILKILNQPASAINTHGYERPEQFEQKHIEKERKETKEKKDKQLVKKQGREGKKRKAITPK